MSLLVPAVGENKLLECMLGKTTPANLTLKLFVNDKTPDDGDVAVAVKEVQTITVDASGGTYTITWNGQTTSAIAYNAAAATVQAALEALSNIAPGDVVVTGGVGASGGGTPYTLTWSDTLGNVAQPTTNVGSLTGGAGTAAVSTTTPGVAGYTEMTTQGYSSKTLTMATWNAAAQNGSNKGEMTYPAQSWTFDGTGGATYVYGYYIVGYSGTLLVVERFGTARYVQNNGDVLTFTPRLTLSKE